MSEALDQKIEEQVPEPAPAVEAAKPSTAGEMLRAAREAAGLHIAALAVSLKVSVKKLEALETDRFDLLPDAVFVRGLASSVCRALKIDPAPVLAQLPQTNAPRLRPDEYGLNTPFTAPGDVARASVLEQVSRPGVLAALVFLVGALVLIFFPSMDMSDKASTTRTTSEVIELPAAQPAPSMAVSVQVDAPEPGPKPATVLPAPSAPSPAVSASPQVMPPPVPVVAAPAAVPATAAATPAQPAAGTNAGLLVFKTRGPSWVEVTDAKGVVQLRRTLMAGETVAASGTLPLSVVVGRVDTMVEVQVRGKPFSLEAVTRENVARFEVK